MFGIGTWELIVILVLALLILGPDKLPGMARKVGRSLAQLRQTADEVKREINLDSFRSEVESELTGDPAMDELQRSLDVRSNIRQAMADLDDPPPLPDTKPESQSAPESPDPSAGDLPAGGQSDNSDS